MTKPMTPAERFAAIAEARPLNRNERKRLRAMTKRDRKLPKARRDPAIARANASAQAFGNPAKGEAFVPPPLPKPAPAPAPASAPTQPPTAPAWPPGILNMNGDEIDAAIMLRLLDGAASSNVFIGELVTPADTEANPNAWRRVDRSIQRMKKAGHVEYDKGAKVWTLTEAGRARIVGHV